MEVKPGLMRRRGIARWTRSMAFNTSARWGFQFRLAGIYLTRNWCDAFGKCFAAIKKSKQDPKMGRYSRNDGIVTDGTTGGWLVGGTTPPIPILRPTPVPSTFPRPIAPLRSALPGRFFLQETNRPSIFLEDNQKKFCQHQVFGEFVDALKFNKTKLA